MREKSMKSCKGRTKKGQKLFHFGVVGTVLGGIDGVATVPAKTREEAEAKLYNDGWQKYVEWDFDSIDCDSGLPDELSHVYEKESVS